MVEESKSLVSLTERSIEESRASLDINSWPVMLGRCPELPSFEILFGKGILVANFIDIFTEQRSPTELKIVD